MATSRKELRFNLVASLAAEQESGDSQGEAMVADRAICEGKGVVDLRCTDAMGGERSLDLVARNSMEKYGETGLREESPDGGHHYLSLVGDLLERKVKDPAMLQSLFQIGRQLSEWGRQSVATSKGLDSG